jgi:virulence-associated protein VagC
MRQVAKLFTNGRSQAVRLPAAYRFDTKEVFIRRKPGMLSCRASRPHGMTSSLH